MIDSSQAIDKASYRNKGGLFQRLISRYKAWTWLTKCGEGVFIKRNVEFSIASGGLIYVGGGRCRFKLWIHKMKSNLNQNHALLFLFYFITHGLIFFFVDTRFWDDWSLYKASPDVVFNLFLQAGGLFAGYLHIFLQKIGWWSYPFFSFFGFFAIVLFAYNILVKLDAGEYSSFWVALFIGIMPVNFARVGAISLPSTLLLLLFMISWSNLLELRFFRNKNQIIRRLLTLLGFFVSFQLGSLLVFYILPIVSYFYIFWKSGQERNVKNILRMPWTILDFISLPLLYVYFTQNYFIKSGVFSAGYNNPKIDLTVFFQSFSMSVDHFFGNGFGVSVGLMVTVAVIFVLLPRRVIELLPNKDECEDKAWSPLKLAVIGLVVSYLSVFPYSAVGKVSLLSDWTSSRHQLLLMFGWSFLIFAMISYGLEKFRKNNIYTSAAIPLLVVFIYIVNWWHIYSEFFVDHIKQSALIALISREPKLVRNNILIIDKTGLSAFDTKAGLGEYAAIYFEATGRQDSLFLDYDSVNENGGWVKFTNNYSKFLGTWSKTEDVELAIKPSLYILKKTIDVESKLIFSAKMLMIKVFRPRLYGQRIEKMLYIESPLNLVQN